MLIPGFRSCNQLPTQNKQRHHFHNLCICRTTTKLCWLDYLFSLFTCMYDCPCIGCCSNWHSRCRLFLEHASIQFTPPEHSHWNFPLQHRHLLACFALADSFCGARKLVVVEREMPVPRWSSRLEHDRCHDWYSSENHHSQFLAWDTSLQERSSQCSCRRRRYTGTRHCRIGRLDRSNVLEWQSKDCNPVPSHFASTRMLHWHPFLPIPANKFVAFGMCNRNTIRRRHHRKLQTMFDRSKRRYCLAPLLPNKISDSSRKDIRGMLLDETIVTRKEAIQSSSCLMFVPFKLWLSTLHQE